MAAIPALDEFPADEFEDADCCGDRGEIGGADNDGDVTLYPPPTDEFDEDDVDDVFDPMGLLGLIFATSPATPTIANKAPHQNPFDMAEDLAMAASLERAVNLSIMCPSPNSFPLLLRSDLRHH